MGGVPFFIWVSPYNFIIPYLVCQVFLLVATPFSLKKWRCECTGRSRSHGRAGQGPGRDPCGRPAEQLHQTHIWCPLRSGAPGGRSASNCTKCSFGVSCRSVELRCFWYSCFLSDTLIYPASRLSIYRI